MAPSQTRLVISGITGERVWRERVEFWKGVYGKSDPGGMGPHSWVGFDMTTMDSVYFNEGLVEYVDEKEIVTDEVVVRVRGSLDDHLASNPYPRTSTRTTRLRNRSTSRLASSWLRARIRPSAPS